MKFLIAGLGNIGFEYEQTRHNIGFDIVDELAKANDQTFASDRLSFKSEVRFKGRTLILIKPTTYMNLSGKAVNYWMQAEKISRENLLVICDDIALPFGVIRIRQKGNDGGHNGLSDIIQTFNSTEFTRMRFGVGNNFAKGRQAEYVLGKWNDEEQKLLPERINVAVEAIKSFCTIGASRTMTVFNRM